MNSSGAEYFAKEIVLNAPKDALNSIGYYVSNRICHSIEPFPSNLGPSAKYSPIDNAWHGMAIG